MRKRFEAMTVFCVLTLAVVCAGGCAGEQAAFKALSIPAADLDKAFDATRTVLERHFDIAYVDRQAGLVETQFRVNVVDAGLSRFPRAFLNLDNAPDELFTHRRRARAAVRTEAGVVVVSLTVEKERLFMEAGVDPTPGREYDPVSSANPTRFGGKAWRTEESWFPVGSDTRMEQELLKEIEKELARAE